jgi:type IX secretion system PorP/SprF family membrane protein
MKKSVENKKRSGTQLIVLHKNATCFRLGFLMVIFAFVYSDINAQQQPMYSQYMFNMLNINPAYAGSRGVTGITGLYRNQWQGIDNAPRTTVITLDMSANNKRIGLGFQLYNDQLGVEKSTGFNASYAFRIPVSHAGTVSLGLQAGLLNYRANFNDVSTMDPNDPTFNQTLNGFLPAAAAGIFYNADRFYVGLSTPALLKTKLSYDNTVSTFSVAGKDLHLYLTTGFVMRLSDNVMIKPSVLVKAISGAPLEYDLNTNVWFHDILSLGFSYRTGDAIVGMAELQLNRNLRVGYAYDKTITELGGFNSGTHELMLRFEFGSITGKAPSARYF